MSPCSLLTPRKLFSLNSGAWSGFGFDFGYCAGKPNQSNECVLAHDAPFPTAFIYAFNSLHSDAVEITNKLLSLHLLLSICAWASVQFTGCLRNLQTLFWSDMFEIWKPLEVQFDEHTKIHQNSPLLSSCVPPGLAFESAVAIERLASRCEPHTADRHCIAPNAACEPNKTQSAYLQHTLSCLAWPYITMTLHYIALHYITLRDIT